MHELMRIGVVCVVYIVDGRSGCTNKIDIGEHSYGLFDLSLSRSIYLSA